MSWAINERFDLQRQVVRAICEEIARGTYPPGDALPAPHLLAKERILNPRVVESVYARLVEAGVLVAVSVADDQTPRDQPTAYQTAHDAQRLARGCLLRWAREEVRDLVRALGRAGLSGEDVQRVFREVGDV